MSEFHIEVVELGEVTKHDNADSLSITNVHGGYPVVFRTGDFTAGSKAVYIPVDSIVPDTEDWDFLRRHRRIKAKRLRGTFSMGMLWPAKEEWEVGQDVQAELGITKWDPIDEKEERQFQGKGKGHDPDMERDPGYMGVYDIEGIRKYKSILVEGEEVVVTEKIHGANARFVHDGERLWVGSRNHWKRPGSSNMWWHVAGLHDLETKLKTIPGIGLYGEIFGQVQDLKYGSKQGEYFLRFFDALRISDKVYLDYDDFLAVVRSIDEQVVPELYRGPWNFETILPMSNGESTLAANVREGFVVKPVRERWNAKIQRVILKLHGEDFLLRKD